jgi:hypothetical protein
MFIRLIIIIVISFIVPNTWISPIHYLYTPQICPAHWWRGMNLLYFCLTSFLPFITGSLIPSVVLMSLFNKSASVQTNNRCVPPSYAPLWFSLACLRAYSTAKVKTSGDKAYTYFRKFWAESVSDTSINQAHHMVRLHTFQLFRLHRSVGIIAKSDYDLRHVCLSVRPSARNNFGSHWMDFHEIWYLSIFRKSVEKI